VANIEPNSSQDVSDLAGAIVLILAGLITIAWTGLIGRLIVHVLPVAVKLFCQLIGEASCGTLPPRKNGATRSFARPLY
jgi:hypothetical protein